MKYSQIMLLYLSIPATLVAQGIETDTINVIDDLIENGLFVDSPFSELWGEYSLIRIFGEPDSIIEKQSIDPNSNTEYTTKTYYFQDIIITYYGESPFRGGWLVDIEVFNNKYKLKHGISIGMRWAEISKRFGVSLHKRRHKGLWHLAYFHSGDGFPHAQIQFVMVSDTVAAIRWSDWP